MAIPENEKARGRGSYHVIDVETETLLGKAETSAAAEKLRDWAMQEHLDVEVWRLDLGPVPEYVTRACNDEGR